jgi:hypothetical protein
MKKRGLRVNLSFVPRALDHMTPGSAYGPGFAGAALFSYSQLDRRLCLRSGTRTTAVRAGCLVEKRDRAGAGHAMD